MRRLRGDIRRRLGGGNERTRLPEFWVLFVYISNVVTYTLRIDSLESLSRTELLKTSTVCYRKLRNVCFVFQNQFFVFCVTYY